MISTNRSVLNKATHMSAKEKILTEAANLIHTKGFNNTSIQDILDASEVTKSNFYYHFESKERLGFDVLEGRMRQFEALILEPSLGNADLAPVKRIESFLAGLIALSSMPEGDLGCPFGNLAQEMSAIHEPLRQALCGFFTACAERLERCFDDGKISGDFSEDLPSRQLAEFVLAQIQGAFLLRKTHRDARIMEGNMDLLRRSIDGWSTQGRIDD